MIKKTNANKSFIEFSTKYQPLKECKEIYGKSESTFRNLVRAWRSGQHQGNIVEHEGKLFFKTSWLDQKFKITKNKATATANNEELIKELRSRIKDQGRQITQFHAELQRFQLLLAYKEEKIKQLETPKKSFFSRLFRRS